MSIESTSLLRVEKISKHFGSTQALNRVSLSLKSGEVLCIVGENGAGKSTLIKILSGAIAPDSGTLQFGDEECEVSSPAHAISLGLATIYQEVELINSLSVAANIFLGQEPRLGFNLLVDAEAEYQRARKLLDTLHIKLDEKLLVERLSAAQKQTLQIVKALHQESRILIMDEPTSSLGFEEKQALMTLVQRLRDRGLGIIYISHHLEEVFEIGDTIMILKDGHHVGTYAANEVDHDFVVRKMVGREASAFFARESAKVGEFSFRAENLSWRDSVVDVSFAVRRGEIFGIGGLVGSGRSELANIIFGVVQPDSGQMFLEEKPLTFGGPVDAIKHGICLISEDRHSLGMFLERSVTENLTVVHNEITPCWVVGTPVERKLTDSMIDKLHIATSSRSQSIANLSGGNQQKVMIARWLVDEYELYIFDEPTKGVDVGAKQEIYGLMVSAVQNGKCVIMISSDMPELLSMSDRIGVMRNGRMVQVLENNHISEDQLITSFLE